MAKTMETLKVEAMRTAKSRGHKMTRFSSLDPTKAVSRCQNCGFEVMVNSKPLPSEVDIGGQAVALNCQLFDKTVADLVLWCTSGDRYKSTNPYMIPQIVAMLKALAVKYEITEWMDAAQIVKKRFDPEI